MTVQVLVPANQSLIGGIEMKKKLALVLALALTASMALTSCGNPNDPGSASGSGSGSGSGSTPQGGGSGATVTLATGGTSGTYYAYGGVMQTVLNPLLTQGQLNVTSTGASSANVLEVADGNAQMSILQSDVLSYAHTGTDLFTEAETSSQWVAGLYNETVQIIAAPGITDVSQLKGKTVCVGDVGSGTEVNARQVLEAYGMTFDDITVTNGGFGTAANDLKDGKIDAAFTVAGAPTTSITELDATADFDMISLTPEAVEYLTTNYPFLVQEDLPAGTYSKIDYDVTCVAVKAVLVASEDLSEDFVYELLTQMFENKDQMAATQGKFEFLTLENAVAGVGDVPMHPGATKYFTEQGVL